MYNFVVDLVKCDVPLAVRYSTIKMTAIIIIMLSHIVLIKMCSKFWMNAAVFALDTVFEDFHEKCKLLIRPLIWKICMICKMYLKIMV